LKQQKSKTNIIVIVSDIEKAAEQQIDKSKFVYFFLKDRFSLFEKTDITAESNLKVLV
jgi:hypothetical protein